LQRLRHQGVEARRLEQRPPLLRNVAAGRETLRLAVRRSQFNPNDIHVKSAFYATDKAGLEIARMYERLLNSPRIEVRVWSDIQAAADWLGVERKLLES